MWLRKMYKCYWTFHDNVLIIVDDDGEAFHIDPTDLDTKGMDMLAEVLTYQINEYENNINKIPNEDNQKSMGGKTNKKRYS